MFTILEEFWIFSKDGVPYVNFFREDINNTQFEPRPFNRDSEIALKVESVLKLEEQELSKKNFIAFNYKNSIYIITLCLNNYLHLVLQSSLEVKIKKINNIAKIICSMIDSLYKVMDFRTWKGDLEMFDSLRKKIDLYFKMSNL